MKSLDDVIAIVSEHKNILKEKYKVNSIKVFGSYANGTQKQTSDIDLIVDFENPPTFFEFMELKEELEKIIGIKVDLLTNNSISPYIKPYIEEIKIVFNGKGLPECVMC